jgi:hypothetical protein
MELASMLAGEPFSDRPAAACPVVAAYLRSLNDALDDRRRQQLYPYAAAAVGTRGDEDLRERRVERCRLELRALRARHTWLGRLVARAAPPVPRAAALAPQVLTESLIRSIRRTRGDWHVRALALADELIAMPVDKRNDDRRPEREPGTTPTTG